MASASDEAEIQRLAAAGARMEPGVEATRVTGGTSGRGWAAAVNAVAANWNEVDEGYRPATCHGGLYALPAAMAEVEAQDGSLGQLLVALVVGYEVSTAYARVMPPPKPLLLHPHATLSPVGAAAAVAAARGANGPGVRAATDVAITLAAVGPFEHATRGILARNAWVGHGALTGFTAVEFASAGISGSHQAPQSVLRDCLGYQISPDELDNPWDRWAIHDGYHKEYACCQYAHSAVEAALELANGPLHGLPFQDIAEIEVATHPLALALDDIDPKTVLGGKFSVPHSVASALVAGSSATSTFGARSLDNPDIAALRARVTVVPYDGDLIPPFDRPATVTVTLTDGTVHIRQCRSAIGGPDRPMDDAAVLNKAALLTQATMPDFAALAEQLINGEIGDDAGWRDLLGRMWRTDAQ